MSNLEIFNYNLDLIDKNLPKNIYGIKVLNVDKNETFNIAIEHIGYCPALYGEREESRFNDYLSNLEYKVIDEYFKTIKKRKPKNYYSVCEIITNEKGELYRYSKSANL